MAMRFDVVLEGTTYPVEVAEGLRITVGEATYKAKVDVSGPRFRVRLGRKRFEFQVEGRTLSFQGKPLEVVFQGYHGHNGGILRGAPTAGALVRAPMPGRVVAVLVEEGASVARGAPLLILEAMKMQNEVPSPAGGVVKEVQVRAGTTVGKEDILLVIE